MTEGPTRHVGETTPPLAPPPEDRPADRPAGPDYAGAPRPYPAEKARQGEIILRSRTRRAIFLTGLAGIAVVVLLLALLV